MNKIFVLASHSPRRKQLLEGIGLKFKVDPATDYEEIHPQNSSAHEIVRINAMGKAESIAQNYNNAMIIGVDTVGAYEDHILEKPKNQKDAVKMLTMIQGTTHEVLSGLCLIDTQSGKKVTAVESTSIEFLPLTQKEIEDYLRKGESMDKAAAYAVQGMASLFVKRLEGDYFNVVGLPMYRLNLMLKEFDINLMDIVK